MQRQIEFQSDLVFLDFGGQYSKYITRGERDEFYGGLSHRVQTQMSSALRFCGNLKLRFKHSFYPKEGPSKHEPAHNFNMSQII